MSSNTSRPKVTFWQMWRDIFVTAINKGQFLTAILGLFFLIVAWRLPPEELTSLVKDILLSLKNGYVLGYVLFALSLTGWYIHSKRIRTLASKEEKRIGNEKSELQRRVGLGNKVRSSRKK